MRTDNTNPYVGLRPYEVDESILFFGRSEQTLELLQRLHLHHFVAVVGSSGCGKSSLLRAGLIPALKAGYLVDDSDDWFIAIMKPGQSPLYNLAEVLLLQLDPTTNATAISSLEQKIKEEGIDAISNLISPVRKEKNVNFFLLVDQFEELFRFAMDQKDVARKDEAIDFVNIMLELSQQKDIPFYVVVTMRSDFIGDCDHFYGLPEAMNKSQYLVPRLNRMELKTVIEGPAKLYGSKIDPSLTSRLLNDAGKVKDELPLLQHALMRTWDFEMNVNNSGELDLQDYESIGGIEKALSNHGEEALAGMSEEDLRITKKLFQALTAIDENRRKIRRPVLLSQLKELTGTTEQQLLSIINLFIKDRRSFLIISNAGDTGDKVIDISHESLIRQWNTLSHWVDEEGEAAAGYLQLAESARFNKQNKKDFLSGSELQISLEWRDKYKPTAAWANRYEAGFDECMIYLDASEEESNKIQNLEKARKKKQRHLIFAIMGLLSILAVSAGLVTYYFLGQNKKMEKILAQAIKSDSLAKQALQDNVALQNSLETIKNSFDTVVIKPPPITNLRHPEKMVPRTIGSNINGDIVFYVDQSGEHGLLVAKSDQNNGKETDWYTAKDMCENLALDSFDNWRLPTIGELKLIYDIRNKIRGLNTRGLYWSSTNVNNDAAYLISFSNGSTSYRYNKKHAFNARAVRSF